MLPSCRLKRIDGRALVLTLVYAVRARSSGRNAHIKSSTVVYVIKKQRSKKLSETCTNPEVRFLAQKYSVIRPNFFFLTLSMLSMRIKLFTSVNNSECMKQHCTPPLSAIEIGIRIMTFHWYPQQKFVIQYFALVFCYITSYN